jgi:cyclophilin family peptidyl-prolyl cis-trans isomerase
MTWALVLALGLPQATPEPVLHDARVVLRTSKGDLSLVLYGEVAPRHVAKFLKLVRAGYYEGTRFAYVFPGFVIHHAGEAERVRPLKEDLKALAAQKMPAEFSALRHARGVLSMARMPDDVDSATSVFCILLGDAPHLDGKYTIFGRVVQGFEVLDALGQVDVDANHVPKVPLNLHHAWVEGDNPALAFAVAGTLVVLGLGAFLASGRRLPRNAGPIGLSAVIAGFFIGFVAATPRVLESGENRKILGLIVFVSMLALFRLMTKYESPKT